MICFSSSWGNSIKFNKVFSRIGITQYVISELQKKHRIELFTYGSIRNHFRKDLRDIYDVLERGNNSVEILSIDWIFFFAF